MLSKENKHKNILYADFTIDFVSKITGSLAE